VWAERRIAELNQLLTLEQRQAVGNVCVYGFVPQWFYTTRLQLRPLPQDNAEREALLSGLDALANAGSGREAA
jgi:hypothetical protein